MSSGKKTSSDPDPFLDAIGAMSEAEGVDIRELAPGDVVDVETVNHVYTFILTEPSRRTAEAMSNGHKIVEPTDAIVSGSLLGNGSAIRPGWIGVGYQLEVHAGGRSLHLTETKRIAVNGVTICPRQEGALAN